MDDMESIKAIYFEECGELLADLEEKLITLDEGGGDEDTINAVFRAVHSVKGGAGAFGFDDLVSFAHIFETTLDLMRSGKLAAEGDAVKVLLRASDVLVDFVQAAKGLGSVDESRSSAVASELEELDPQSAASAGAVSGGAVSADDTTDESAPATDEWGFTPVQFDIEGPDEGAAEADWLLTMRPSAVMYQNGHDAAVFLRELAALGDCEPTLDKSALPSFDELDTEAAYLSWTVRIAGSVEEAAIREVFDFVGEDCEIQLAREKSDASAEIELPDLPDLEVPEFEPLQVSIEEPADNNAEGPAPSKTADAGDEAAAKPAGRQPAAAEKSGAKPPVSANATIRVELDRVDRMIDLVGELVINQAMLAQRVAESDIARSSTVAIGLDELEQLTREIQDSVMAIRAQPVKSVFQRMPRLVREIADSTGKKVRLVMEGEHTEVDKTVIERLADPITHMLRNAIDHGLESPEARRDAGKPEEGAVRLAALHRSGRIVIEISDDGKGIDRVRVREIAEKKGLIAPDAVLSDEEIDNLIFMPGFSTASTVSNISGRGVGMDVVKRSIQALGGRIAISSVPGKGSAFTLSLPLTLAVLDGMVLGVGEHTLVAPLSAIMETLRPKPQDVRRIGPRGAVLAVRGGHVPLIDVGVALGWRSDPIDPTVGVVLLVESEVGGAAALVVDQIHGQRQVVIKSLEANYGRVETIAAATILGDGRVALILDVDIIIDTSKSERLEPRPLAEAS